MIAGDVPMAIEMRMAETDGDRARIFRHRYEVYCEELRRYRDTADHRRHILRDDIDDVSRHCGAWLDGELAGSMRWTWGGDAPFTPGHVDGYRLAGILESVAANRVVIGERFIVSPEFRDIDVASAMYGHLMAFVNHRRIALVIGRCEPHLLNHYIGLGYRPYSMENIDSADAGYVIPLMLIAEDVDHLRAVGSPLAAMLRDFAHDRNVPQAALDMVAGASAVRSGRLASDDDYWREVQTAYALGHVSGLHLFEGLAEAEVRTITENSSLIECRAGDRVLKKREVARNMYVVLSGSLEVRDDERYLATLMRGDVIGEIAFLLSTPRTADVVAMLDGTKLLSLSETTVRDLTQRHPELAAKFLLNVARLLCAKLAFRTMQS